MKRLNQTILGLIISFLLIQATLTVIQASTSSQFCIASDGLEITSPTSNILSDIVVIRWRLDSEFINSSAPAWYDVYYSPNGGDDWIQIAFMTPYTSIAWNTALYEEYETDCLLRVIAGSKNWDNKVDISDTPFIIDNREPPSTIGNDQIIQGFLGFLLLAIISVMGYLILKPVFQMPTTGFTNLLQSTEIEFLRAIRNKVIVGLDNIKSEFIPESQSFPTLELPSPASSMMEYFPTEFQNELRSEMKGRTVLTLIEIAYQNPDETNPNKLAKSLNIPISTLSKEIKKLSELNYVESYVSAQVLQDGRYRNFKITSKGFSFLNILNTTLKITIEKLKDNSVVIN